MHIALGADERLPLVDHILAYLKEKGHSVTYTGPEKEATQPWPQVAADVARSVAAGDAHEGILLCWTGTGVSIAANKVPGIRAALCRDAETAKGARLWNDANLLCLSMRATTDTIATEILDAWFATAYQPNPEDDASLTLIQALDDQRES